MKKRKILCVDDDPVLMCMLTEILKSNNYVVESACTGKEGIQKAQERPDLILLDRSLPDLDGLEVCRCIRKSTFLNLVPIIFLTSYNEIKDIVDGLYVGADDYMTKPFDTSELLARIGVALKRKEQVEQTINDQKVIIGELISIISKEKITSFLQPIFSLGYMDTFGFEAFSNSPLNSLLCNTNCLFNASERFGMYNNLELLCWRKAVEIWKHSKSDGMLFLKCRKSFIENEKFGNELFAQIGISSKNIVVEIDKNKLTENKSDCFDKLHYMRDLGLKVSVDGFVDGNFTMNEISEMKPDFLKLDTSIFHDIKSNKLKERLFKITTNICRNQGTKVILKDTMGLDELGIFKDSGADYIQGNVFCSPKQKLLNCSSLCNEKFSRRSSFCM